MFSWRNWGKSWRIMKFPNNPVVPVIVSVYDSWSAVGIATPSSMLRSSLPSPLSSSSFVFLAYSRFPQLRNIIFSSHYYLTFFPFYFVNSFFVAYSSLSRLCLSISLSCSVVTCIICCVGSLSVIVKITASEETMHVIFYDEYLSFFSIYDVFIISQFFYSFLCCCVVSHVNSQFEVAFDRGEGANRCVRVIRFSF